MHPTKTKRVIVRVPGSTANLGPGFDALALALEIYTTFSFELVDKKDNQIPLITLNGQSIQSLPRDKSNLSYQILGKIWHDSPSLLEQIRISITSEIPLCRGLGSSASAILGTIWAANVLSGNSIDYSQLLAEATSFEGHPDNIAASLWGGLVICGNSQIPGKFAIEKLDWPEDWCTLVVVPSYELATKQARSVLPKAVPMTDAVHNIGNVALLVSAVANKNEESLRCALSDHIHQPYRLALVPELAELSLRLKNLPALGCVLSGAGPSVLVLVARRHKKQILDFLNDWAQAKSEPPQILDLKVAAQGIKQLENFPVN